MPKTFWQSVFFTTLMATFMVLIMSHYNMLVHAQGHFERLSGYNFCAELFFALPVALLFAGKLAPFMAHKVLGRSVSQMTMGITITFFIAVIMVPIMSLFILVRKVGIDHLSWSLYGKAIFYNFIMAFPIQVLFLGRLVRHLFRHSIGIQYRWRRFWHVINPYLRTKTAVWATKAALIANALVICILSI